VLSGRLKMLLEEELIERQVYSQHPLRAEYRLTDKGRSLLPIMLVIGKWGLENTFEDEPEAKETVMRAIHDHFPEARPILVEGGFDG
jgi:DNA-binding HxlR family transcriptional regulator